MPKEGDSGGLWEMGLWVPEEGDLPGLGEMRVPWGLGVGTLRVWVTWGSE